MSHPVTDLVVRIKNGYMAGRAEVDSPYSHFREKLATKLKELGYVREIRVEGDLKKTMTLELVWEDGLPAMTDIKIFSTPGRRWYVAATQIKPVIRGLGYSILSTSQGLMTHVEAKKKKIGGELLFAIW